MNMESSQYEEDRISFVNKSESLINQTPENDR